jgi:hypothetical protein
MIFSEKPATFRDQLQLEAHRPHPCQCISEDRNSLMRVPPCPPPDVAKAPAMSLPNSAMFGVVALLEAGGGSVTLMVFAAEAEVSPAAVFLATKLTRLSQLAC